MTDNQRCGLETNGGMYLNGGSEWDKSEAEGEFAKRMYEKKQKMPTTCQAGDYSATLTYLKADQAAGTTEADAVMKQLKTLEIDDMFAKGYVRADGTMVHDMYLMQVKTPAESKKPWDYYKTVATIPGDEALDRKSTRLHSSH